MNGATIASSVVLATVPLTYTVVGVGDFNGDGKADILWRNANGDAVVSLMTGTPSSFAIGSTTLLANLPADWQVAGVADFNGDGRADILWRNAGSGDVVVSAMNGASITSTTFMANLSLNWQVAGVGDFNADGKADILWRDTSGNLVVSLVNGATITATTFVASLP
jgi:hypothetical protein